MPFPFRSAPVFPCRLYGELHFLLVQITPLRAIHTQVLPNAVKCQQPILHTHPNDSDDCHGFRRGYVSLDCETTQYHLHTVRFHSDVLVLDLLCQTCTDYFDLYSPIQRTSFWIGITCDRLCLTSAFGIDAAAINAFGYQIGFNGLGAANR